jgi:CheY-like chemotaxis protein
MHPAQTFLVVDDDGDMRFLHRCELEKEFPGCTVLECETAEDAFERSGQIQFDAVLTDYSLRGENGTAFIARLRALGATYPVVMVTGSSDPKIHDEAYHAGATRVFFGTKLGFAPFLRTLLSEARSVGAHDELHAGLAARHWDVSLTTT